MEMEKLTKIAEQTHRTHSEVIRLLLGQATVADRPDVALAGTDGPDAS
jgi:hypothetical protein